MSDQAPKSAIELAMERLQRKDAESGVEAESLTDEQKAAIAEARSVCDARSAERRILHESAIVAIHDPQERRVLEEQFRRDLARFQEDRDRKIAEARGTRPAGAAG